MNACTNYYWNAGSGVATNLAMIGRSGKSSARRRMAAVSQACRGRSWRFRPWTATAATPVEAMASTRATVSSI